jgi:predicted Na+-dependent transporter
MVLLYHSFIFLYSVFMLFNQRFVECFEGLNVRLERLMPILTPLGVFLGILLPRFFIHLRPLIPWMFGIMTLSGSLKLKVKEFGQVLRNPLPILLFFFASHVLMPLAALLAASLVFRGDPDTVSGYILVYSVPTAVSGFIWVNIYKGDNALALALILISTVAAPLVVPGTMSLLMGTRVSLDMSGIALSLILMVVVPTLIGVSANEASRGEIPRTVSPFLNPLAKVCLILVIAANTSAAAPQLRFADPHVWLIAAVCIFFAVLGYFIARFTGIVCRLRRDKRVTIFFSFGLRNISAATTIAIEFFPQAAALPALLGIVFQQSMAAIMGRLLLGPVSGKAPGSLLHL